MVIGTGNGAPVARGVVGVITAGTSDVPYAQECVLLLEELGVRAITYFDAGVAGIHRPVMSLQKMRDASVLIVFAGMEGALPTVLASLTDLPVIAVPLQSATATEDGKARSRQCCRAVPRCHRRQFRQLGGRGGSGGKDSARRDKREQNRTGGLMRACGRGRVLVLFSGAWTYSAGEAGP
jgi:hypothetical protein